MIFGGGYLKPRKRTKPAGLEFVKHLNTLKKKLSFFTILLCHNFQCFEPKILWLSPVRLSWQRTGGGEGSASQNNCVSPVGQTNICWLAVPPPPLRGSQFKINPGHRPLGRWPQTSTANSAAFCSNSLTGEAPVAAGPPPLGRRTTGTATGGRAGAGAGPGRWGCGAERRQGRPSSTTLRPREFDVGERFGAVGLPGQWVLWRPTGGPGGRVLRHCPGEVFRGDPVSTPSTTTDNAGAAGGNPLMN